jgi:hypothetical protein
MIKKISDIKKFWLVTILYLVVFWILPTMYNYVFFNFLNSLLLKLNVDIESVFLYYLLFIPVILFFGYRLVCNIKIKFAGVLFFIFYILVPYLIMAAIFFYGLNQMLQNFNPSI